MEPLSSRQRILRTLRREPADCVAVAPYIYDLAAASAGVSIRDFYSDPGVMVDAQLKLHERIDQDVIAIGADNYYIAQGFGCQISDDPDELPSLVRPAVASLDKVVDLHPLDPQTNGRMPVMLEAIQRLRGAVGDRVAIRSPGTGPFALASYLVGSQTWLMEVGMLQAGMADHNRVLIEHALEIAAETLIRFGKACWDAGADILHCGDSLSSCDMISPAMYREFALPYQKRVFEAWRSHGVTGSLLHICGDSTPVLKDYADTSPDIVEIDHKVEMSTAKRTIGDRVILQGNLHTVDVLLHGTVAETETAARRCIEAAGADGGFILGSGCIVPRHARLENLEAMVRTARRYKLS